MPAVRAGGGSNGRACARRRREVAARAAGVRHEQGVANEGDGFLTVGDE